MNLGEDAAELIECDTGEKLLKDWKLFRYCTDPFMIQCLETACAQGTSITCTIFSFEIVWLYSSLGYMYYNVTLFHACEWFSVIRLQTQIVTQLQVLDFSITIYQLVSGRLTTSPPMFYRFYSVHLLWQVCRQYLEVHSVTVTSVRMKLYVHITTHVIV